MSKDVAAWVVDPIGSALGAAGLNIPFAPGQLINPPKRPKANVPPPPPAAQAPPAMPGMPGITIKKPPPPPPVVAPKATAPSAEAAYAGSRTGARAPADRTRGLINPGSRTLLG